MGLLFRDHDDACIFGFKRVRQDLDTNSSVVCFFILPLVSLTCP